MQRAGGMNQYDQYYRQYSATPSGYSMSSGVSTPAMTPPIMPMWDSMMAHQPAWMGTPADTIVHQIQQLQRQTASLMQLVKTADYHQRPPPPQVMYPAYMAPPSPAPPLATGYHEALHAAHAVLGSVPPHSQLEESVLARAVVAAANALVAAKTGNIASLRSGTPQPQLFTPTAVRSQTPAWLNQAAETVPIESGVFLAQFRDKSQPESPAPSEGSPGISKANSPLADVLLSLSRNDGAPVFGIDRSLKSPGTVTKCARQDDDE